MKIDPSALQPDLGRLVATASSERSGRPNWTVLSIYERAGPVFTAEIVGETTVAGQVRRVRRHEAPTLARALNWNGFDHKSALFDELRQRIIEEVQAGRAGALPAPAAPYKPPVQRSGFDGAGGLYGALEWLYQEHATAAEDEVSFVHLFESDFGISAEAVFEQLEIEERGEQPEAHLVVTQPRAVEWRKAFIASLAFFDREAFLAQRRPA